MVDAGLILFLLVFGIGILWVVGDLRRLAVKSAAETARQAAAARVRHPIRHEPRTEYTRNDFIPFDFRQAA
jgi:hypothetical protein